MEHLKIKDLKDSPENNSSYLGLYSFYDIKSKRYDTPFFCQNDMFSQRHYAMVTDREGTMLNKFKTEFNLHRLGWFDQESGLYHPDPKIIIDGEKLKKPKKPE